MSNCIRTTRQARTIRYGMLVARMTHDIFPHAERSQVYELFVPSKKQRLERKAFTRAWDRLTAS